LALYVYNVLLSLDWTLTPYTDAVELNCEGAIVVNVWLPQAGQWRGIKRDRSLDKMWPLTAIVISFPPGLLCVSLKRLSGALSS
jgi:hypothetical protein